MRIAKMEVACVGKEKQMAVSALRAAFSQFDSITMGVNVAELAEQMVAYLAASTAQKPEVGHELLKLLSKATASSPPSITFGRWRVGMRTASGTLIAIFPWPDGYLVEVDFGPEGSETRARRILSNGQRVGIHFTGYGK